MNETRERILFLYLSTGGGHISAARALANELEFRYSPEEVEIHLFDGIPDNGSEIQRTLVERGYRFSTLTLPFLWSIIYQVSNIPFVMNFHTKAMNFFSVPFLRKYIRKHRITRVVNLHFLLTRPLFRALRQTRRLDIPVVTVVLDPFSCHPLWFYRQFAPMIVFSQRAEKQARTSIRWLGMPPMLLPRKREVVQLPPILSSKFNRPLDRETRLNLRDEYGFSRDKRLILMAGGGEGLPRGEKYLEAISRAGLDTQIVFVCGRNISQYERVQEIAEKYSQASIHVFGFVNFMYELMNMADVIVTKAGPATIFEALLLQKPLILTQRLYGQEQGNVDFVVNNQLGWFITKPRLMMEKINEILEHPELFDSTISRIRKAGITNGTSRIVDYIMNLPALPEKRNKILDILYSRK
ncbi:glycosyltransferase [Salinispira pacifica]|uniref:Monogalactosyldiacylglycerol synthase n=1 Tax=Salinispira pacifica TaxID=1307761 RepID=V5WEI3_9SPIO|nr:glycosyltransferase [Salinispira pacifica]AHC14222.1 Monogalactosyldiacylglycerol synthase [Salinispira pacifica]